ncbi:ATP F0F1 synthase subunit B [Oceanicella actignis]|uniref:F0F1 ATP synthase subunit B family protein n=1 Tax=Oceanicella actignis TaxID=1189325 RepID=UPI0011E749C4|nr:ATP F0F1 synthase subunit B [Oceanicella actignis]TYO88571.1 F-type H+-transporting ATPase subunit b [Oceanicella actignis]
MELLHDSYFVVAIAFFCFIGVLLWLKVPARVAEMLDKRIAAIRQELDDARRLREEAQALLASFERKQKDVEGQVADIKAHARLEAEEAARVAQEQIRESVARRIKAAEEQIQAAEKAAIREVRERAAAIAVAAAADVLSGAMTDEQRARMTDESIAKVGGLLH